MGRKRLTITLKKDLIKLLDQAIDGMKIRNRSHAIEYFLTKSLAPEITKVLILAGGKGVKLRPFTYEMPKSLIPIKGRPLLEHTIDLLKKYNLKDIVLSIGYLGDKIKEHFEDGSRFGLKIHYLNQKKQEGTNLPVLEAKEAVADKTFLVIYGDVLADVDLYDLIDFHKSHRGLATMALTSVEKSSMWGVVNLKGAQILDFVEKPEKAGVLSHLINAGIYVFNPEIFKYIPKKSGRLEQDVFPRIAHESKLYGYPFEGQWFDIGTPETYEQAVKEWKGIR